MTTIVIEKITDYPVVPTPAETDVLYMVQSATDYQTTRQTLRLNVVDTVTASDGSYSAQSKLSIVLDNAGADIALVFSAAIPDGACIHVHALNGGTTGHTVKLNGQPYDGTNNTATFAAAENVLVFRAISPTRVSVTSNTGVTFSST